MADVARTDVAQEGPHVSEEFEERSPTLRKRFRPAAQASSSTAGALPTPRLTPAVGAASLAVHPGQTVGRLASLPVIAARVFGHETRHDEALALARQSSRMLQGAPVVVLETTPPGAGLIGDTPDGPYAIVQAALPVNASRPSTDEVLGAPVQDQRALTRRVTDIVFGDVSMVVPGSMTVSPWLYLLD